MRQHKFNTYILATTILFSGISVASANGDAAAGQKVYKSCKGCHSLADNRTGPRHCGLLGRAAGTEEGFNFSSEMKNSGLVWDAETLDRFIAAPLEVVPGTTMGFAGIKDQTKRENLVAYLIKASQSKTACSAGGYKQADK